MSDKSSKLIPIFIVLAFVVIAGGLYFTMFSQEVAKIESDLAANNNVTKSSLDDASVNNIIEEQTELTEGGTDTELLDNDVDISLLTETQATSNINIDAAVQERILGNPDAPIKISEHSSFSCGHCGRFHQEIFKDFKANWIDTGRAYLVFSDFPLNAPALHASLAGRCINDNDQYFAYVEEVFARQDDWAFQSDHLAPLKEIASKYGVSGDYFNSCIQSQELQEGMLAKLRAAQQQFGVDSTPTFVVNNSVAIKGPTNYAAFNEALENALNNPQAAPDDAEPAGGPE